MLVKSLLRVRLLITILVSCLILFTQNVCASTILKGQITDALNSVVPQAVVSVQGEGGRLETTTSEAGEYIFTLKPGIYKLQVNGFGGFSTTYRAPIKLNKNITANINLKLYSKFSVVNSYTNSSNTVLDGIPLSEFRYEEINFSDAKALKSGMIRFGIKKTENAVITYKSGSIHSVNKDSTETGVTFTYNLFTILADEMKLYKKSNTICAKGNLIIEENGKREEKKGEIKIKIDKYKVSYMLLDQCDDNL